MWEGIGVVKPHPPTPLQQRGEQKELFSERKTPNTKRQTTSPFGGLRGLRADNSDDN